MKKYALPLALVSVITLQACNQQSSTPGDTAADASATVTLDTTEQRLSYGIAYGVGNRMAADNVPIDVDSFSAGLKDGLEGSEPRMTNDEIAAELTAFQAKVTEQQEAAKEALGEANRVAGEAFIAENSAREGVVVTESGLQYEILEEGDGPKPGPDDTVEVHYRGTLVDGTEFDSSYSRGQTVTFGVGQVIPGWTEALQLMPVGSKWKLAIPAHLGYGRDGAGQMIGPYAALIFDVELIGIPSQADPAGEADAGAAAAGEAAAGEATEGAAAEG